MIGQTSRLFQNSQKLSFLVPEISKVLVQAGSLRARFYGSFTLFYVLHKLDVSPNDFCEVPLGYPVYSICFGRGWLVPPRMIGHKSDGRIEQTQYWSRFSWQGAAHSHFVLP